MRIDSRSIPGFIQGTTNEILRRRKSSRRYGTSVCLVVDDSGSMGDIARETWSAAAMIGHACERANLRSMIMRFAREVGVEKSFHNSMASVRKRLGYLMGGGTDAAKAIEAAHGYMSMETSARRVVFFLCDGHTADCRKRVRSILSEGIEFYPVMMGEEAVRISGRNSHWDFPQTSRVLDVRSNLASTLAGRLCSAVSDR